MSQIAEKVLYNAVYTVHEPKNELLWTQSEQAVRFFHSSPTKKRINAKTTAWEVLYASVFSIPSSK